MQKTQSGLFSVSLIGLMWLLLAGCNPALNELLTDREGEWQVRRFVYEFVRVEDLIERTDTVDQGTWVFEEGGLAYWLQDSVIIDSMAWNAPMDNEVFIRFQNLDFEGRTSFTFQVLENRRSEQLWRAEEEETVYDPLRLDSVPATHLFQVSLFPVE